jgi:hypothetical protein
MSTAQKTEPTCTAFSIDAIINGENHEISVTVEADFIPGEDAHVDEYGRPTECSSGDEWDIQFLSVNGQNDPDITPLFVSAFLVWDRRLQNERPMKSVDEFYQLCYDYLYAELETGAGTAFDNDYLPF